MARQQQETIQFTNPFAPSTPSRHQPQFRPHPQSFSPPVSHTVPRHRSLQHSPQFRRLEVHQLDNHMRSPVLGTSSGTSSTENFGSAMTTAAAHSDRTYLFPTSPLNRSSNNNNSGRRTPVNQVSRPKILKTKGQRPAALVNASVTYCGGDQIYAFGGFDQFTDEVYNHVLRLDLETLTWTLVDNYGEIPGVRMGHTASLWEGDKLLIYGGENEHRDYLSDIVVFDIKTATWSAPPVSGPIPRGRARHAAVIQDNKLFICGGVAGLEQHVLSDICYLDLKNWTWSRSWRFVPRFDHVARVWGDRLWVFGGLGPDTERTGEIWWLDLRNSPAFQMSSDSLDDLLTGSQPIVSRTPSRLSLHQNNSTTASSTTHIANSRTATSRATATPRPIAPGVIGSMQFHAGAQVPSHTVGTHFYTYSSGAIVDFATPIGSTRPADCSISSFELSTLQWQKLAEGTEIFDPAYRWQYCAINEEGTKAWLLGCPSDSPDGMGGGSEEFLSDVLALDLTKFGLVGEDTKKLPKHGLSKVPPSDACSSSEYFGPAVDLANIFDKPLESECMSDFQIIAIRDDFGSDDGYYDNNLNENSDSAPINVHKLILLARWPHFKRAFAAQMAEFHNKKMRIEEPYSVVRAFLWYLYTDSIDKHPEYCPSLHEVAGMMVMANVYDMPRLRALCVHRLSREIDVESAATIWERAGVANDEWLTRRAASFCLTHWGRIVRTQAFKNLPQQSMVDLCEVTDIEARVVGGDELELVGGLGGGKFGFGGIGRASTSKRRVSAAATVSDILNDGETEDEEAMEVS